MPSPTTLKQEPGRQYRRQYTVPIFPHLKKFIAKTYGAGVIRTEESTVLGRLVTAALRDNLGRRFSARDWPYEPTETITILLTKDQAHLSPKQSKLLRINVDVSRMFRDSLIAWIIAQQEAGMMAYPACRAFLDLYGIEDEEYSIKTAYKQWQRVRDQVEK
jgi:hypothetical protein